MKTIPVKILGTRRPQRYCVARSLLRAQFDFERGHPEFRLDVQQVTTSQEILQYTPVIAFPSLMIGEKLVCVGRFPSRDEILGWLEQEIRPGEESLQSNNSQGPINNCARIKNNN